MADKEEKKEDQIVEEKANEEVVDEEEDEESEGEKDRSWSNLIGAHHHNQFFKNRDRAGKVYIIVYYTKKQS